MDARIKRQILNLINSCSAVFVGVGNSMRSDDAVGPYVISRINHRLSTNDQRLHFIDAGEMPENYIGKISQLKPRTVVVIDALDFKTTGGDVKIAKASGLRQVSFSTHGMSLGLFSEQIKRLCDAEIFVIGIQPQSLDMGEALSPAVKRSAEELVEIICENRR